jgi:3-deoxy-D-manno-octulosonic acid kinase
VKPAPPDLRSTAERIRVDGVTSVIYDERFRGYDSAWFDRARWAATGARLHSTTGRGGVLLLDHGNETWVYRHYHRGGFVAHFVYDHYLWLGLNRSRPFREWRLLDYMQRCRLPTPRPVAARVERLGVVYQADIITVYLPDTTPLSAHLREGALDDRIWLEIGATVKRLHEHGVDHPDLTAHNILLDTGGRVFVVDFDNARVRPAGRWEAGGLARLQRSLRKVALETGTAFDEYSWNLVLEGYR